MEPATKVLGDLFVVLLSNHNQLQPSVTSLLFLRWPWWVFYKARDRIPWHAAWTPPLLSWEGGCWVFPAVSCLRSWTQLLQHAQSTLEIEDFFPSIWLLKLARTLSYPTTKPACAFHTTRTLCMWSSSSPWAHHCSQQQFPWREGWIFFSVGSEKSSAGNWQCDQNHVKSLCWSTALKAHILGQVTEDWQPLCLLLFSLIPWLGMEPVAAWTWLSLLWTYSSSCRPEWDLHNWQWWWFLQTLGVLVSLRGLSLLCHLKLLTVNVIFTYPLTWSNKAVKLLHLCRYCKSFHGCRADPVSPVDNMCVLLPSTPTKAALQFLFIWLAL